MCGCSAACAGRAVNGDGDADDPPAPGSARAQYNAMLAELAARDSELEDHHPENHYPENHTKERTRS